MLDHAAADPAHGAGDLDRAEERRRRSPAERQGDARALARPRRAARPRPARSAGRAPGPRCRRRSIASRMRLLSPADAAEHRVAGVAEHDDARSARRRPCAPPRRSARASRTWNASRSDQARSASSSASRSASARSPSVTTIAAQPPSATSSQGCIGKFEACSTRGSASMARARSNQTFIGPCAVRNCSWCEISGILRHAVTGVSLAARRCGSAARSRSRRCRRDRAAACGGRRSPSLHLDHRA